MVSIKLDEKAILAVMSCMGDEQKIELQNAVVAAFAKHYLKDVVADPKIQSALDRVTNDIERHILEEATTAKKCWNDPTKLGGPLRSLVTDQVNQVLRDEHYTVAKELIAGYEEKVEKSFNHLFQDYIRVKLSKLLNETVANDAYTQELITKRAHEMLKEKLT